MKSIKVWSVLAALAVFGCGGESEPSDTASPLGETEGIGESTEGGTPADPGGESITEAVVENTESGEETGEEAIEGSESEDQQDGQGTESGEESGDESSEAGDEEEASFTVPRGSWLIWTDSPVCSDSELMATRFGTAGYAVLTVVEGGAASLLFHDSSFETFREYTFPEVLTGTEETYEVRVEESVEEIEGSNCTINRVATLSLNASLGAWEGTLTYEEFKKGGGCFSDGCEGVLDVKTQDLVEPVNPLYLEGNFPFLYSNAIDGVEESGQVVLYPVAEQPYFFELDIPNLGTSLQTIRGKKYIVGQGNRLWGRAVEFGFVDCPDVYSVDQWDVQLTVDLGPSFGGSLVHTTRTFDTECNEITSEAYGTMVGL